MKHSIDFALTTYCQARCRSCARTNIDTGKPIDGLKLEHMDINLFKNVVENKNKELDVIEFCGEYGDPCMHPDIDEFIKVGISHCRRIEIYTNGALRKPDWYKHIAETYGKKVSIQFCVDGANHDTNWKYREGVDRNRAMDNMKSYFQNGGKGRWEYLIFSWNWTEIPLANQIAKDMPCEIKFKWNRRKWGLISPSDTNLAQELLETI